ncbi:FtsH protease activity modulator HflK [Marinomonas agarivorans]|nr:FtsH protease activity modulator HflK [Marinomonas agarivorans]
MAWNEPGNNDNDPWNPDKNRNASNNGDRGNDNDPWGRSGRNDQNPPDLDEAFRKLMGMLGVTKKGGGSGGTSGGDSKMGGSIIVVALVAVIALWAASGVYQVDQQERGVVLRFGEYHSTVLPGLHWNPSLIDNVMTENVTKVRSHDHKALMLTEDEAIVEVGLSVQYLVANPKDFLLNVRNPEASLAQATESALRHVVGTSKMDRILTEGRELLAQDVKTRLQGYLDDYVVGISISQVNIENVQAPQQVQAAFDDVIKAKEDEQRVRNEAETYANGIIPEARGRAQRIREEAEAYRAEIVSRAEGQADRFDRLYQEYAKAPEVTRRRLYIETVEEVYSKSNKVMIDVEGGNNMMYLPLDKIMSDQRKVTRPSGVASYDLNQAEQVIENLNSRQSSRRGRN